VLTITNLVNYAVVEVYSQLYTKGGPKK